MKVKNIEFGSSSILCPLLTTLFVGLKLTGYIDWSWWWVFSPLWIPFVIALVIISIVYLVMLIEDYLIK